VASRESFVQTASLYLVLKFAYVDITFELGCDVKIVVAEFNFQRLVGRSFAALPYGVLP
jgi:hypothetical protein